MDLTLRLWIYVTVTVCQMENLTRLSRWLNTIPSEQEVPGFDSWQGSLSMWSFHVCAMSSPVSPIENIVCQVNSPVSAIEHGTGIDLQLVPVRCKLLLTHGLNAEHKFPYRDQWRIAKTKLKISEEKKGRTLCILFTFHNLHGEDIWGHAQICLVRIQGRMRVCFPQSRESASVSLSFLPVSFSCLQLSHHCLYQSVCYMWLCIRSPQTQNVLCKCIIFTIYNIFCVSPMYLSTELKTDAPVQSKCVLHTRKQKQKHKSFMKSSIQKQTWKNASMKLYKKSYIGLISFL